MRSLLLLGSCLALTACSTSVEDNRSQAPELTETYSGQFKPFVRCFADQAEETHALRTRFADGAGRVAFIHPAAGVEWEATFTPINDRQLRMEYRASPRAPWFASIYRDRVLSAAAACDS